MSFFAVAGQRVRQLLLLLARTLHSFYRTSAPAKSLGRVMKTQLLYLQATQT
jgi:hypothetical protein